MALNVKYLFFHTAAADIPNVDAARIDQWHKDKGWSGIGYHYVIIDDRHDDMNDGDIETGRPEGSAGAHVLGVNSISLGICCVGHGDVRDFTSKQKKALVKKLAELAEKYNVKTKNILGHREINKLIAKGVVDAEFKTTKSCPGNKVDVDEIRALVAAKRGETGAAIAEIDDSIAAPDMTLATAIAFISMNEDKLGNAKPEWRQFLYNGETQAIVERG